MLIQKKIKIVCLLICVCFQLGIIGTAVVENITRRKISQTSNQIAFTNYNPIYRPPVENSYKFGYISSANSNLKGNYSVFLCGAIKTQDSSPDFFGKPKFTYGYLHRYSRDNVSLWNRTWEIAPWTNVWDVIQDNMGYVYTVENFSPLESNEGFFPHLSYYNGSITQILIRKWDYDGNLIGTIHFPKNITQSPYTYTISLESDYFGNIYIFLHAHEEKSWIIQFDSEANLVWNISLEGLILKRAFNQSNGSIIIQIKTKMFEIDRSGQLFALFSSNNPMFGGYKLNIKNYLFYSLNDSHDNASHIVFHHYNSLSKKFLNFTYSLTNILPYFGTNLISEKDSQVSCMLGDNINRSKYIYIQYNFLNNTLSSQVFESNFTIYTISGNGSKGVYVFSPNLVNGEKFVIGYFDFSKGLQTIHSSFFFKIIEITYPLFDSIWIYLVLLNMVFLLSLLNIPVKTIQPKKSTKIQNSMAQPILEKSSDSALYSIVYSKKEITCLSICLGILICGFLIGSEFPERNSNYFLLYSAIIAFLILVNFLLKWFKKKKIYVSQTISDKPSFLVLWYGGILYLAVLLLRLLFLGNLGSIRDLDFTFYFQVFLTSIVAIVEEFLFRRNSLNIIFRLKSKKQVKIIVMISQSILWCFFHFDYWSQPFYLVVIFAFGLYLCYISLISCNIIYSSIIHIGINILGLFWNVVAF